MALNYFCRHCGVQVGSINQMSVFSENLGFNHLSGHERQDMIDYQTNGDIHVKTICEDCQEALERNPDLHQYEKFIQ